MTGPIDEAIALLIRRRSEAARAIEDIDRAIEQLRGNNESQLRSGNERSMSIGDQILAAMSEPRMYTADEILGAVDASEASVRSILSRLVKHGELVSPRRGRYLVGPPPLEGVTMEAHGFVGPQGGGG